MISSEPKQKFEWVKDHSDEETTIRCKYLHQTPFSFLVQHQGSKFWVAKSFILKQTANSITVKSKKLRELLN